MYKTLLGLRSNLFNFKPLHPFTWNASGIQGLQIKRFQSNVKTNEHLLFSGQASNISPVKIKQSIRKGLFNFIDGPTSIQSVCPICPDEPLILSENKKSQPNKNDCLYINKTTGK